MSKKVLVIGAHPDDETLGVGGTICKHLSSGDRVYIYILGEGVAERHCPGKSKDVKRNCIDACTTLGVSEEDISFGGYLYDMRFTESQLSQLIEDLEEKIYKIKPDVIYTHHLGDANSDHGIIHKATMAASRPIARCNSYKIKRILAYETLSSTEQSFQLPPNNFSPNVFVNIEHYLDKKIKAFRKYETEIKGWPHPRSEEGISIQAKFRGCSIMAGAAEAFMLLREVK